MGKDNERLWVAQVRTYDLASGALSAETSQESISDSDDARWPDAGAGAGGGKRRGEVPRIRQVVLGLTYSGPAADGGGLRVKRVRAGSPCDGAVREGDVIAAIDGAPLTGLPAAELTRLSLGPAGSEVTLAVVRAGGAGPSEEVTVVREEDEAAAAGAESSSESIGSSVAAQLAPSPAGVGGSGGGSPAGLGLTFRAAARGGGGAGGEAGEGGRGGGAGGQHRGGDVVLSIDGVGIGDMADRCGECGGGLAVGESREIQKRFIWGGGRHYAVRCEERWGYTR